MHYSQTIYTLTFFNDMTRLFLLLIGSVWFAVVPVFCEAQSADPYLTHLYDRLHDSPLQAKFRRIAPMPIGAVYVQRPGEGESEIRAHFRTMKRLGYNSLKQIMTIPGWTLEQVQLIALEEGIIPWWYGEGGWEALSDSLLDRLKIPRTTPIAAIRQHPAMLTHQQNVMRQRILRLQDYARQHEGKTPSDRSVAYEPELGGRGFGLTDRGRQLFKAWVKKTYGTIDRLNIAWNQQHAGLQPNEAEPFQSWDDFDKRYEKLGGKEYKHLCDILDFKVEYSLERIRQVCEQYRAFDSSAVFRGGGEIGLFHPLAWYGVDLERIAGLMSEYGSFYPSVHFAWHYGEVDYELVRPMYMQAALATDFFKGGWAATWESTGGPQQFSGGKGGANFTVDEGTMTQFLLSQLAAGFKGWGTWAYNARTAGWEAGEYALLDRHNHVTPRAERVGQIGQAANRYRDELWAAHKEPLVGVFYDWHNEAVWAAMTESGRNEYKDRPIQARIGISRALINANVPFEYVTSTDILKGLAGRYRIIYLPAQLSLDSKMMQLLSAYVRQGGRLVMDTPTAYYDQNTALFNTDKGTVFEQTFGTVIREYQGSGVNRTFHLNGRPVAGMIASLAPTSARTLARFDSGLPAVTEHAFGKGTAVVLAYEASLECHKANQGAAEKTLLSFVLGGQPLPFQCDGVLAYRLATPTADHYFLVNDGPAKTVRLTFRQKQYRSGVNALTNKPVNLNQPITVEAHSGSWLRLAK
jgi:beta-galactosidase